MRVFKPMGVLWCGVLLLCFLVWGGSITRAEDLPAWRWSHPLPHGNNVADLVHRGGRYVHVTERGGVYVSTNRFIWERRNSGTTMDLRGAAFLGDRLLVTGEEGTALWSDDGSTFHPSTLTPPTSDWLEGVAASTDRAVAVGDNAAVYTTLDGRMWSRVGGVPFSGWLTGVAYGGGVFVCVGDAGLVASSADGVSWTRRNSGTSVDLMRVAYGDGRFLVVGRNGVVLTSLNGTAWAADAATGVTNSLLAALPVNGERLVVGESALLLRRPPAAWVNQASTNLVVSPVPEWTWAAAVWDGDRYLVGGRTGVFVESWRTNSGVVAGQTLWFRNDESPRNLLWDVARFDRTYLAVGDVGTVLSSAAGVTWTAEGAPVTSDVVLYGIGGSPDMAIAVGSGGRMIRSRAGETRIPVTHVFEADGVPCSMVVTQTLGLVGVLWEEVPTVTTTLLQGVAWNAGRFVVTGAQGTVLTSSNGWDWSRSSIAGAGLLSSVAPFGGGFVAVGAGGQIHGSPDGAAWTARVSGTTNWVYRVRNLDGTLVATGQGGTLLVSSDGVTWGARPTGSTEFLTDVCKAGRFFHVCGTGGTLLRSSNLVDWVPVPSPTGKSLFGLATDGAQVVTVGAEGVVLRAIGDPAGSPVRFAGYSRFTTNGVPVEGLVVEGSPERVFRLESGSQPGSWTSAAEGVLDASGVAVLGRRAPEPARFHRTAAGP